MFFNIGKVRFSEVNLLVSFMEKTGLEKKFLSLCKGNHYNMFVMMFVVTIINL